MLLKPNQRWKYTDNTYEYVVEISTLYNLCKIVQIIRGCGYYFVGSLVSAPHTTGLEHKVMTSEELCIHFGYFPEYKLPWTWEYLEGQDSI
jgi:hypothetical protein